MAKPRQIVVVGGGVVGLACAVNLQRAGARVAVFDAAGNGRPASYGNAGHIAVEQVDPLASPAAVRSAPRRLFAFGGALDFRLSDVGAWGPWAVRFLAASTTERASRGRVALSSLLARAVPAWRRLAGQVGEPGLVLETGHLVLWESDRSAEVGRRAWATARPPQIGIADLTRSELDALAPWIKAPIAGGVTFHGTGQVSAPGRVLARLKEALIAAGGALEPKAVARLSAREGRAQLTTADGEEMTPDAVVVAGGVGSGPLMRQLGHAAPVIAERGYHVEGSAEAWGELPPVVFEDRSLILTRFGDRLRAASFVEFGRADSPADARKWARIERHLRQLGVEMPGARDRWMGARPTLPDYLPAIGQSRRAKGLFYAFGHQHLGLTLSAVTGELIGDLVAGQAPRMDLAPFDVGRFDEGGREQSQEKR